MSNMFDILTYLYFHNTIIEVERLGSLVGKGVHPNSGRHWVQVSPKKDNWNFCYCNKKEKEKKI